MKNRPEIILGVNMKGGISLQEFIESVKSDLKAASKSKDPFFIVGDVELEVSFSLQAAAGGKVKFLVVDAGGDVEAHQTHKVKLTLTPFEKGKDKKRKISGSEIQRVTANQGVAKKSQTVRERN